METIRCIVSVGVPVAALFITGFVGANREKRLFNGGSCRECGGKLRHFDSDSQGGRGYVCRHCGNYVWVSYPSVDRGYDG